MAGRYKLVEKRCIEGFGGKDGMEDCARRRVSKRNRRIAAALGAEINRQGCLEVNWPKAKRSRSGPFTFNQRPAVAGDQA